MTSASDMSHPTHSPRRDRLWPHLIILFPVVVGLYALSFWWIESRRVAQSPWVVAFEVNSVGQPELEIHQQSLQLGPVKIRLNQTTTNAPLARKVVEFRTPKPVPRSMPVGQCMFEDLTFLPGTVALKIGNVDIQMLRRVLTIGTNEFSWPSARVIEVAADGTCRVVQ